MKTTIYFVLLWTLLLGISACKTKDPKETPTPVTAIVNGTDFFAQEVSANYSGQGIQITLSNNQNQYIRLFVESSLPGDYNVLNTVGRTNSNVTAFVEYEDSIGSYEGFGGTITTSYSVEGKISATFSFLAKTSKGDRIEVKAGQVKDVSILPLHQGCKISAFEFWDDDEQKDHFEYNAKGQLVYIKGTYYAYKIHYEAEKATRLIFSMGLLNQFIDFEYNTQGQIVKSKYYDENGNLAQTLYYAYNSNTGLLREIDIDANVSMTCNSNFYQSDNMRFAYDNMGNVAKVFISDYTQTSFIWYDYQYDYATKNHYQLVPEVVRLHLLQYYRGHIMSKNAVSQIIENNICGGGWINATYHYDRNSEGYPVHIYQGSSTSSEDIEYMSCN